MIDNKTASRIALIWHNKIRAATSVSHKRVPFVQTPYREMLSELTKKNNLRDKLIRIQRSDNLKLAEKQLRIKMSRDIEWIIDKLLRLKEEHLNDPMVENESLSHAEITREIIGAAKCYGDRLRFEHRACQLILKTNPIELEEVKLGAFDITIKINNIDNNPGHWLKAVALNPNPAAGNPDTTHPHVDAENVCLGDGHEAVVLSAQQGRVFDLVSQIDTILNTYGAGSPYVPLNEWDRANPTCYRCDNELGDDDGGVGCDGCGNSYCFDCSYVCSRCGSAGCQDCFPSSSCSGCSETICNECTTTCICGENCCRHCLNTCERCKRRVCDSCIDEENCVECVDIINEEKEKEEAKVI